MGASAGAVAAAAPEAPGRFLPSLRGSALDRVSLLELGTYTAGGLPLQFPDGVADEAAMIAWFRDWQPSAPPGTQRRYSNPSLGLFGAAAAAALGGNFTDLMETRLFPEIGLDGRPNWDRWMDHTAFLRELRDRGRACGRWSPVPNNCLPWASLNRSGGVVPVAARCFRYPRRSPSCTSQARFHIAMGQRARERAAFRIISPC